MYRIIFLLPLLFFGCQQPKISCTPGLELINGTCVEPVLIRKGIVSNIECVPLKCETKNILISLDNGSSLDIQSSEDYYLGQIIEVVVH